MPVSPSTTLGCWAQTQSSSVSTKTNLYQQVSSHGVGCLLIHKVIFSRDSSREWLFFALGHWPGRATLTNWWTDITYNVLLISVSAAFCMSQMKEVQVALHLKLSILFSHSTREISKDIRDEGNNKRYSWSKRLNKPPYSSCCRWWRETQPLYTSVAVLRQCWFTDFDSLTTMMSSGHALCGCPMGTANCSSCYTGSLLLGSRIGAQESSLRQKSSLNCLSKSFSWRLKR